ncbi:MAG: carboxylate-amine ligase [Myxococcales bacterium]|nr:carboxylate-amine ligase [Myxococcales bacterium]
MADFSVGIEEEFFIVDPSTRALAPGYMDLFAASENAGSDAIELKEELHTSVVEVGTPVCSDIDEARHEIAGLRGKLDRLARQVDLRIAAVSTHPFSRWEDQGITAGPYQEITERFQDTLRANLICGMHVHVCLDDPDERIAVYNQARYFLPHLLALSCSSPFWQGRDTGLSSHRAELFKRLPRTGIPSTFQSWREYSDFIDDMVRLECVDSGARLWWDLRPSVKYPTLEFRICDLPMTVDETVAIAALIQALVARLADHHRRNWSWRNYPVAFIQENKWRALRYGSNAKMIDWGRKTQAPLSRLLEELIEFVEPEARRLGCMHEVVNCRRIMERGCGADRQRREYLQRGDLKGLVDYIIEQTTLNTI